MPLNYEEKDFPNLYLKFANFADFRFKDFESHVKHNKMS
jgi:hypothetical protein